MTAIAVPVLVLVLLVELTEQRDGGLGGPLQATDDGAGDVEHPPLQEVARMLLETFCAQPNDEAVGFHIAGQESVDDGLSEPHLGCQVPDRPIAGQRPQRLGERGDGEVIAPEIVDTAGSARDVETGPGSRSARSCLFELEDVPDDPAKQIDVLGQSLVPVDLADGGEPLLDAFEALFPWDLAGSDELAQIPVTCSGPYRDGVLVPVVEIVSRRCHHIERIQSRCELSRKWASIAS